jgi:iron-sulfur cluster repair protein YtfE (RIC family)
MFQVESVARVDAPSPAKNCERILSLLPTKRYREQHDEIKRLIAQFQDFVQRTDNPEALSDCRGLLLSLMRKLTVHLEQEDDYLYPRLMGHEDDALREMAIRFKAEMGGLQDVAKRWAAVWLLPGAATKDPARFKKETNDFLNQLSLRIIREETQLYPMIDQIGWSAVTGIG